MPEPTLTGRAEQLLDTLNELLNLDAPGTMQGMVLRVIKETLLDQERVTWEAAAPLLKAGHELAASQGHRPGCAFSGCTCGVIETRKEALAEYWRESRAYSLAAKARGDTRI